MKESKRFTNLPNSDGGHSKIQPTPEPIAQLPVRINDPLSAKEVSFLVTTRYNDVFHNVRRDYQYNFYKKSQVDMSTELGVAFLKAYLETHSSINDSRIHQFVFTGGEPTINPGTIFSIMDYIHERQIDCVPTLHTNGIITDELLERLIEYRFLFQLSHDIGGNAGQLVAKKITRVLDKLSGVGLPVVLRPAITQENVHLMPNIVKFAKEHGACAVVYNLNDNLANVDKNQINWPDKHIYTKHLFEAMEWGKIHGIDILMSERMRLQNGGDYQQLPKLVLLPDGRISTTTKYLPGQNKEGEKGIIGRFSMQNGIEIFQDAVKRMASNLLTNLDMHCKSCECFKYCRGRNKNLRSFRESVVQTKDEYRCDITRDIYRRLEHNITANN